MATTQIQIQPRQNIRTRTDHEMDMEDLAIVYGTATELVKCRECKAFSGIIDQYPSIEDEHYGPMVTQLSCGHTK